MTIVDSQENMLQKCLIALDSIKDVSSSNELVKLLRNRIFVGQKAVKVSHSKLWKFLSWLDLVEVVVYSFPEVCFHEITAGISAML